MPLIPRLGVAMSSVYQPHWPSYCIDGKLDHQFCHSLTEASPWISVQLPVQSSVAYVVVYNRRGCCYDRLSPFQLWVGASAGDYNSDTSTACGVHNLTVPPTAGPFGFNCSEARGEYVTIVLPGPSRILNLAEIQV